MEERRGEGRRKMVKKKEEGVKGDMPAYSVFQDSLKPTLLLITTRSISTPLVMLLIMRHLQPFFCRLFLYIFLCILCFKRRIIHLYYCVGIHILRNETNSRNELNPLEACRNPATSVLRFYRAVRHKLAQ